MATNTQTAGETAQTPEPWIPEPPDGYMLRVMSSDGTCILSGGTQGGDYHKRNGQIQADLRRAMECVNACAGISDPADLRRQRDELLEALRDMVSDHASLSQATLEFAKRAIANATKQP